MVQNRGWCSPGLCAGPTHLPQAWIGCWTGLLNHARLVWRLASSLTDLDFADDVSLLAELLELLVPILETIASEAASLGFEVNCQKTKVQESRSLSTLAPLSTHQPEALVTSAAEVPSLVLPCRA